jgi:site-specific DNA-methyltransferase (adenine-specific)
MKPYQLHHGDCLEVLATMADNSVDAVVTDPPYGLSQHKQADIVKALTAWINGEQYTHNKKGFMGKTWDSFVPGPEVWKEVYRVLKPGGHALVFASTRTQDLMAIALRLAGFEYRDTIMYCFGSGFPHSTNVSKMIYKAMEVGYHEKDSALPATPEAQQWAGFGTALKPSFEPVIVARKLLSEKTVAANVLAHGTGAINIDGCRVDTQDRLGRTRKGVNNLFSGLGPQDGGSPPQKRWPANVIHDGSDEVIELFPNSGKGNGGKPYNYKGKEYNNKDTSMFNGDKPNAPSNFNDSGSAARYFKACPDDDLEDREIRRLFYCAKASKRDRNEGLEVFGGSPVESVEHGIQQITITSAKTESAIGVEPAVLRTQLKISVNARRNNHVTVKPTALMRYLCRLVTPPGGIVLDPFMGSGSTGKAAMLEGFQFIGIEREDEYVKIAQARIEYAIATKESQDTLTETTTSDPRQLSIDDI